jgi:hypothetical protein
MLSFDDRSSDQVPRHALEKAIIVYGLTAQAPQNKMKLFPADLLSRMCANGVAAEFIM